MIACNCAVAWFLPDGETGGFLSVGVRWFRGEAHCFGVAVADDLAAQLDELFTDRQRDWFG